MARVALQKGFQIVGIRGDKMLVDMRGLKNKELELLKIFIDTCEKLQLKYYMIGGTLLGAVRHKGFIPWDDDIDVAMPRKEYEEFLQKAQELLPKNVFVQSYHSDPNVPFAFAKLRDSDTTFVETSIRKFNVNHGVYIDIFPIDFYPEEELEQKKFDYKKTKITRMISKVFTERNLSISQKVKLLIKKIVWCGVSYKKKIRQLDQMYKSVSQSKLSANHSGAWGKREIMPFEWYGEGVDLEFEGILVKAPSKYHELLTNVYGDYMTPPPEDKRVAHHYNEVIDLSNSYEKYDKKTWKLKNN